jgi:site-specific recombinase XerD
MDTEFRSFLRTLAGSNKSQATIIAYRTDLTQFLTFLHETDDTIAGPQNVRRSHIAEYLADLAGRERKGVTRARKLAAIRALFRFLAADGLIPADPTRGVETPKKEQLSRTILRPEEYTKLLALAGANPRDFAILQLFLQTGIRINELCCLTLADLDLPGRTIRITQGKGGQARTIELEKKGILALQNYLAVRPTVLPQEVFLNYQGTPISPRGVQKMFAKYCKQAGITKLVSPHSLRHTFATHKAERGVSPYQLMAWLGHASLETTTIYVHMARDHAQKAMEATSL